MNKQAFDRVTAARIQVLQSSPFYGLASMRFKLTEDLAHPDMWTDGETLGYSPKWALECGFDLLKGTIAHCAHHVALCHHLRRESRDEKLWNAATDRVVNAAMREAGFVLPKGVQVAKSDGERSAEEIYSEFPIDQKPNTPDPEQGEGEKQEGEKQPDQGDGKGGSQSDQPGECKDAKNQDGSSLSQSQQDQRIQEQLQDTAALAQQANGIGELPGSIARQIQALLYPQQDWTEQLREFMLSLSNDDYSWSRPNRRFIGQGLYLPALQTEGKMGRIVVAIDTSASISKPKLDVFFHELNGILEQCRPESVTVIQCDRIIQDVQEFTVSDYPIEIGEVKGGGGTSLIPPFNYVTENDLNPDCFLYFTDMGGDWPDRDPGYPVAWIDQDNFYAKRANDPKWSDYLPSYGKLIGIPGRNW